MTLPTGTITMNQVNVELGNPGTSQISLNDTAVRNLASIPSGTISMDDLRGKSSFGVVGGTPYSVGENEYNVFTSSGPLTISGGPLTLEYLMIGGGGGAGAARGGSGTAAYNPSTGRGSLPAGAGGGGGAGAYRRGIIEVPGNMSTTVTVGAGGGPGSTTPTTATNGGEGGNSSFTAPPDIGGFTVYAGGGGGGASVTIPGASEYGNAYPPPGGPWSPPSMTTRPASKGSGGGGCNQDPARTLPSIGGYGNRATTQESIENGLSGGNYYGNALPGGLAGGGGALVRGHRTYKTPGPPSSPVFTTGAPVECGGGGIQIPAIFADDIGPVVGEPQRYRTFVYNGAEGSPVERTNLIGGGGGGGYPGSVINSPGTRPNIYPEPSSVGGVDDSARPSEIPTGGGWCGAAGGFGTGIFTPNQNAISNTGSGGGGNAGTRESGSATGPPEGPFTIPYISSACNGGSGGSGIVIFRHMSASNPSDPATIPGIGMGTTAGLYPPATPLTSPTTIRTTNLVCWLDASNVSSYKGSGSTWEDLSGNNNDGTINGNLYFNTLHREQSYNPQPVENLAPLGDFGGGFDFTKEVYEWPGSPEATPTTPEPAKYINMGSSLGRTVRGTIGFYINTFRPQGQTGRYWGVNPNFDLRVSSGIEVNLGGNTTSLPVANNTENNGIYVVVTWNQPAGTCNLYLGYPQIGQIAGAANFSSTSGTCGSITPQSGNFWFGGTPSQPVGSNFRGMLFQAHVYNEVLPAPNVYDNLTAINIRRALFNRFPTPSSI